MALAGACLNSWLEPRVRGPFGDRTLCTVMNDLRVCARLARPQTGHTISVTSGNVLPLLTGGQVVARSNPVSPTQCQPDAERSLVSRDRISRWPRRGRGCTNSSATFFRSLVDRLPSALNARTDSNMRTDAELAGVMSTSLPCAALSHQGCDRAFGVAVVERTWASVSERNTCGRCPMPARRHGPRRMQVPLGFPGVRLGRVG